MIRIGIPFEHDSGWLGGVNYFRNLLTALRLLPDMTIQPVIFVGMKSDAKAFEGLAEIVRSPLLDRKSFPWMLRRFMDRVFPGRDYLLYRLLRQHRIDMLSHLGELWRGCPIPSLGWIPDFQHLHLPDHFTRREVAARNRAFARMLHRSSAIVLSSEAALEDLKRFSLDSRTPVYVLRFNSCIANQPAVEPAREDITQRYRLDRPWFHLPNQFWKHKNHLIVIEALRLLRQQGIEALVVATGNTQDYRDPTFFGSLQAKIDHYGLADGFRILGMLPYAEVTALMRHSVAVINPSLFEGWSTTVEEAKAMGKQILLSDIPVHREQSPCRGRYFSPDKADELAEAMAQTLKAFDSSAEEDIMRDSLAESGDRKQAFAQNYERIVLDVYRQSRAGQN